MIEIEETKEEDVEEADEITPTHEHHRLPHSHNDIDLFKKVSDVDIGLTISQNEEIETYIKKATLAESPIPPSGGDDEIDSDEEFESGKVKEV